MANREKGKNCCLAPAGASGGCRVQSLISVDERGQMVLPKEIRDRAGIRAGDKLALITWEKGGAICCLALIKAEELTEMVTGLIGPLLEGARKTGRSNHEHHVTGGIR